MWQELSSGPSAAIVLGDQEEDDKNFSEWMPEPVGVQPGESAASLGSLRMCMWIVVCVVYSQVTRLFPVLGCPFRKEVTRTRIS